MRTVQLHRHAANYLRRMPRPRQVQMVADLEAVAALDDIGSHPNVSPLSGDHAGWWRLRVGSYRALLQIRLEDQIEILFVDHIGPRGDIYKK